MIKYTYGSYEQAMLIEQVPVGNRVLFVEGGKCGERRREGVFIAGRSSQDC
jgi:hypothetical protein